MKKISTLFFVCFIVLIAQGQNDTTRVLFIGNSYTGVNNLPSLFQQCANSTNISTYVLSSNPGGYTFNQHLTNVTTTGYIQQGSWDFVVLQEQSQMPSFPLSQVETDCFPYAARLNDSIVKYSPCSETVFYQTWGRQNGDASNCPNWPPVCTYEGMDSLLRLRYQMMADANDALVSPVGACWRYIRNNYPNFNLYNADQSHPSLFGSYVAALSFYSTIFRLSPDAVTFTAGLSNAEVLAAKEAVNNVVINDLTEWNIGDFDFNPTADIETVDQSVIGHIDCVDCDSITWYLNNGEAYFGTDLNHTFSMPGLYGVTLVAYQCGEYYSQYWEVWIEPTTGIVNVQEQPKFNRIGESQFEIYPNGSSVDSVVLMNSTGQMIDQWNWISGAEKMTIDLKDKSRGMYFVQLRGAYFPGIKIYY
jgi:hypothetical protein